jgi:hypothetical protein
MHVARRNNVSRLVIVVTKGQSILSRRKKPVENGYYNVSIKQELLTIGRQTGARTEMRDDLLPFRNNNADDPVTSGNNNE